MRAGCSAAAFGYWIQGLAAHVLLRLGYDVLEINRAGHPDIRATKDGRECRFEIEAEVIGQRSRQLTTLDFKALMESPEAFGYFALAISFPMPYWVLVPASKLARRELPCGNALLQALSDSAYSQEWTREYLALLQRSCRRAREASFSDLTKLALAGHSL